jgi:hypothetical protein
LPRLPCLLAIIPKTLSTLDGIYIFFSRLQARRSNPDLHCAEEYFSRISVLNPFSSVIWVHPELG